MSVWKSRSQMSYSSCATIFNAGSSEVAGIPLFLRVVSALGFAKKSSKLTRIALIQLQLVQIALSGDDVLSLKQRKSSMDFTAPSPQPGCKVL